jgi:CcmD family protein
MDQTQLIYLFWGYLVAWLGVVIYIASLVLRERKLRDEMNTLREQMRDDEAK